MGLGSILKGIGGMIPGVGPIINTVAGVAGAAAKGNAQGQAQQATIQQNQDALALKRQDQMHQQVLDAIAAQRQQYGDATKQAMGGGLLQGIQDVSIGAPAGVHVGTVSGGLRPSAMLGASGIGASMQQRGLSAMSDPALAKMTPYHDTAMPNLTSLPKQGTLGKILAGIGTFGSLASPILSGVDAMRMPKGGGVSPLDIPSGNAPGMPTGTPDWTFGGAQVAPDQWAAQFNPPPQKKGYW